MTVEPVIGPIDAPALHVMSYNIRRRMPHTDRRDPDLWGTRKPLLRRLLRRESPTLLGIQEALLDQAEFVRHALGPGYRRIGHGRNADLRGEACPIIWDSTRLHLEHWSQQALSSTPDVPGSTSWGNKVPRFFLTAVFTDLTTGIRFTAVNTHFDHRSIEARLQSAEALLRESDAAGRPTLVMGDFNTDVDSAPHRTLVEHGRLRDTWSAAESHFTDAWGTFLDYSAPRLGRKRIDWILATPDVEVLATATNISRVDGRWPSDHAAAQAVVTMTQSPAESLAQSPTELPAQSPAG